MDVIIWSRVSSESQDNKRQIVHLKQVANEKGWNVKRVFEEKVSGTIKSSQRKEFIKILDYIDKNEIRLVLISEISRIGRRVIDILTVVDTFHQKGIGLFIKQFDMISFQDGQENKMVMLLLQMMSIGAEMENNLRKERQREGIQMAKLKGKYIGRKKSAIASREKTLLKYKDIAEMIMKSDLSLRRISQITDHSINTVRRIKTITTVKS